MGCRVKFERVGQRAFVNSDVEIAFRFHGVKVR